MRFETELTLVQEELCRVIATADRWDTVRAAWQALVRARTKAESMRSEMCELGLATGALCAETER